MNEAGGGGGGGIVMSQSVRVLHGSKMGGTIGISGYFCGMK